MLGRNLTGISSRPLFEELLVSRRKVVGLVFVICHHSGLLNSQRNGPLDPTQSSDSCFLGFSGLQLRVLLQLLMQISSKSL